MRAKIVIGVGVVLLALLVVTASLSQGVPEIINYQGRLTDSVGAPLDGETVDLTFAFYGVAAGGTAYLSVLQEDVMVSGGLYNVLIGSGTIIPGTESFLADVFFKHRDVWMGVTVDTDVEMMPRARITSVPYAMKVDTAWLTAFTASDDFDQDGYPKNNDCDDGDASAGSPWQRLGPDHRVTSDTAVSAYPSLVWTGSEFGLSWDENRDGNWEIYFSRISAAGDTIGSEKRITSDASSSRFQSLSWSGTEFGVSWEDRRDGNAEIYFARISATGDTIGSDLRVTHAVSDSYDPSVAWTGSEFGLSWYDYRDVVSEIYFARVSAVGNTVGSDLRITSSSANSVYPSLSWTGSEFGVSWSDMRDGDEEIYFARLLVDGTTLGSDLRVTSSSGVSRFPSLSWTGSEFGVSWEDGRDSNVEIYFARVLAIGAKIGSDLRVTSDPSESRDPSLSWTGSEFGVSWEDNRSFFQEIYFVRISAQGTKIRPDLQVTAAAGGAYDSSLSWTGSEFGVGYSDSRDGNEEIYFSRIGLFCP